MIEETATVVAREHDRVWVETIRNSACGRCAARAGCGQSLMSKVLGEGTQQQRNVLPVMTSKPPAVGTEVVLGIPESAFLQGAFWMYLAPVFGLILGSVLGHAVSGSDLVAMAGAAAGFFSILMLVRHQQRRWHSDDRWRPRILSAPPARKTPAEEEKIAVKVL